MTNSEKQQFEEHIAKRLLKKSISSNEVISITHIGYRDCIDGYEQNGKWIKEQWLPFQPAVKIGIAANPAYDEDQTHHLIFTEDGHECIYEHTSHECFLETI